MRLILEEKEAMLNSMLMWRRELQKKKMHYFQSKQVFSVTFTNLEFFCTLVLCTLRLTISLSVFVMVCALRNNGMEI